MINCTCTGVADNDKASLDTIFPVWEIELGTSERAALFKLRGSQYFNVLSGVCYSTVRGLAALNDKDYWLFGTNFYRAFEIIHDQQNSRIGYKKLETADVEQKGKPVGTAGVDNNSP